MRKYQPAPSGIVIHRRAHERDALERLRRKIALGLILFAWIALTLAFGLVWLLSHLLTRDQPWTIG